MKRKVIAFVLVLAMCMGLCSIAFAIPTETGDVEIIAAGVTFTNSTVTVNTYGGGTNTAYFSYGQLADSQNLSSVSLTINYRGRGLKINGTTVQNYYGSVSNYQYTTTGFDMSSVVTIEIKMLSNNWRKYYVSAYHSTVDNVTMNIEYENARAFSQLSENAVYGNSGMVVAATQARINTAIADVAATDTMCNSISGMSAAEYKTYTTNLTGGSTPYDLMESFKNARTGFSYIGSQTSIIQIGGLNSESTAKAKSAYGGHGAGGWMYEVTRGNYTFYPTIGINGWKLMPNDVITWHYTCDFGDDLGYNMWQ